MPLAVETPHGLEGRRRVVVEGVRPQVDHGRFAVKRVVGEPLRVEADAFAEGHDLVHCVLRHRASTGDGWDETPMDALGNDRFAAVIVPDRIGEFRYTVAAWVDEVGTWQRDLRRRVAAGQDVAVELEVGAALLEDAARRAGARARDHLLARAEELRAGRTDERALAAALDDEAWEAAVRHPDPARVTVFAPELPLVVNRARARFGSWYELFPRSLADDERHGTLADVGRQLPGLAALGVDVLYLPPIHPIGRTKRKGPDNTTVAAPDDPGSPWGIGAAEGGHTSVHPALGTVADLRDLVAAAERHGIEIALDIAFQCSPDHPWVTEHPSWFRHRPDGTIRYAENPPKRYEDIYPLDFESDDWWGLWQALRDVVLFWLEQGVTIFRVDNPHTKPFAFWEWLIAEVRAERPDAIFLSEAFTRPRVLERLAKLGFDQSYTYFAWRNGAHELEAYLTELTAGPVREYLRASLWPNTPDILTAYLQTGGRAAFAIRLVLAATLGATYGIYGPAFELCASEPREPGSEEYLHSEKYEIRRWERDRPDALTDLVGRINAIRRAQPALQWDHTLAFHDTDNEAILCYSKRGTSDADPAILCVVSVDPHHRQTGWVSLDLAELGLEDGAFQVDDLLGGGRYLWRGSRSYVELDPAGVPAHVFLVRRRVRTEQDFDYWL